MADVSEHQVVSADSPFKSPSTAEVVAETLDALVAAREEAEDVWLPDDVDVDDGSDAKWVAMAVEIAAAHYHDLSVALDDIAESLRSTFEGEEG
jgi:hypothetical protein